MNRKQIRLILGCGYFALLLFYNAATFYMWVYRPGSDGGWLQFSTLFTLPLAPLSLQDNHLLLYYPCSPAGKAL